MQRRDMLATLGVVVAVPWSAFAARPAHIGFISGLDEKGADGFVVAMLDGLRAKGFSDPQTMTLDRRCADYAMDKVPSLVAELQRQGVELIVTHAAATSTVVRDKNRSVPVVYEFSADPIAIGIATAELCGRLGDEVNQAAWCAGNTVTSMGPSAHVKPDR
jgi:ABC-type uncharacterized transport system substrate-binding protein